MRRSWIGARSEWRACGCRQCSDCPMGLLTDRAGRKMTPYPPDSCCTKARGGLFNARASETRRRSNLVFVLPEDQVLLAALRPLSCRLKCASTMPRNVRTRKFTVIVRKNRVQHRKVLSSIVGSKSEPKMLERNQKSAELVISIDCLCLNFQICNSFERRCCFSTTFRAFLGTQELHQSLFL